MSPYAKLVEAEEAFLVACGWTKVGDDAWEEPEEALDHFAIEEVRALHFGHAINSELLHGPERGTCKKVDRDALYAAWEAYLVASGWTRERTTTWDESVAWVAPDKGTSAGYRRPRAMFTKAVNSQKARDRTTARVPT